MLKETRLTDEEMALLTPLIPGPEPTLAPGRVIPVCETRLDGNERAYLLRCLETNWISSAGPFVKEFEAAFSAAVGCAHGVACANGTAALHLALTALGIGPGDEVILPAFTMIATANAVTYTGATPVLADSEERTWNVDPGRIAEKITPRTKAIVVVHTYGHPADMDAILALARRHRLSVVEDAAEAHGATYGGQPVGSLGDVATFSFYGNKIVTTGEGGMVTTNDAALARVLRRLRDHAFSDERHFWHSYLGFNYRMTNLQAAIGLAQTERLSHLVEIRRQNRRLYDMRLKNVTGIVLPPEDENVSNVFWMYGILVEDDFGCSRDALRARLADSGIETRTFFIPMHLQPIYYRKYRGQRFPVAEALCKKGLYLPSGPALTPADIDAVAEAVARAARPLDERAAAAGFSESPAV
jgi:perosamine synthetase